MAVVAAFGLEHLPSDHTLNSEQDKVLLGPEYVRFAVFRDPLARFVSAYKYSLSMLHNHIGNNVREDILNHGLGQDINLFLAHYADQPRRMLTNLHFVPQWFYYVNGKPSILLKQERLDIDIHIAARMAPERFVGLGVHNKSPEAVDANVTLTEASVERVKELYRTDFMLWNS